MCLRAVSGRLPGLDGRSPQVLVRPALLPLQEGCLLAEGRVSEDGLEPSRSWWEQLGRKATLPSPCQAPPQGPLVWGLWAVAVAATLGKLGDSEFVPPAGVARH